MEIANRDQIIDALRSEIDKVRGWRFKSIARYWRDSKGK